MHKIKPSELIINRDGTIFHLHMKPRDLAENVILVGDPARVKVISNHFDTISYSGGNREFLSTTGTYKNTKITALSTGIGTDNIDIVMNELDALVNIDLKKRVPKKRHTALNVVRIGTSGSLQEDTELNSYIASQKAIGFDGLLNYYSERINISDLKLEKAFKNHTAWNKMLSSPYVVDADRHLFNKICKKDIAPVITVSAPGFYGPQGRELRLKVVDKNLNNKLKTFRYEGLKITNLEMECSGIYGLSRLLGHRALTVCTIIANRASGEANENYHPIVEKLVETVLNRLVEQNNSL